MYKLEFLPIAKKDLDDIVYYISNNLKNKTAARDLTNSFIAGTNSILEFPYRLSVYKTSKKLEHEYRSLKINNFLMFYAINENEKKLPLYEFCTKRWILIIYYKVKCIN